MRPLQEAIDQALSLAKADQCIVIGTHEANANIRWANNTTTTNGISSLQHLQVIAITDGRVGSVSGSNLERDGIEGLVRAAEAAAEGKPQAEDRAELASGIEASDWDARISETGVEAFGAFPDKLAGLFERAKKDDVMTFGFAEVQTDTVLLATSTNVRRRGVLSLGKLEFNAKSPDFKRSTWGGSATNSFDEFDLEPIYDSLSQKLAWAERTIDLPAGQYEVILEPSCVADMLIYMYWTATQRDADEGRNVFSKPPDGNLIGEKLFGDQISIYSDPSEPGLEVPPFNLVTSSSSFASIFDNGLPLGRTDWVTSGTLASLINTRHWAQKSGSDFRPYIHNLVMPSDGPTTQEMIASTKRGLLVTCLWYIREVDPQTLLLTGLTRDGVFLIEDGQVVGAVNNFRFNMSPLAMLKQTTEVGRTSQTLPREWNDYFTLTRMPPLRVEAFNMSSVSEAT